MLARRSCILDLLRSAAADSRPKHQQKRGEVSSPDQIAFILMAAWRQGDENAGPMTDRRPNIAVRIGFRFDDRRSVRRDQGLTILRNHACDWWNGVDCCGLPSARPGSKRLEVATRHHRRRPATIAIDRVGEREAEFAAIRGRRERGICRRRPGGRTNGNTYECAFDGSVAIAIEGPDSYDGERMGERTAVVQRL